MVWERLFRRGKTFPYVVSSCPNDADAGGVEEGICHSWGAHRHDNDNGIGCSMRGSEKNAQHTFQQPLPPRLARRKRSTKKARLFSLASSNPVRQKRILSTVSVNEDKKCLVKSGKVKESSPTIVRYLSDTCSIKKRTSIRQVSDNGRT